MIWHSSFLFKQNFFQMAYSALESTPIHCRVHWWSRRNHSKLWYLTNLRLADNPMTCPESVGLLSSTLFYVDIVIICFRLVSFEDSSLCCIQDIYMPKGWSDIFLLCSLSAWFVLTFSNHDCLQISHFLHDKLLFSMVDFCNIKSKNCIISSHLASKFIQYIFYLILEVKHKSQT